jgi:biotin operon repressor
MNIKGGNSFAQNTEGILLPFRLVKDCYEQDNLKVLELFIMLKKVQRNGVFYDVSSRSIAQKTGYSHTTVNTHIKRLEEIGLLVRKNSKTGGVQIQLRGYKFYTKKWGRELVFIKYGSKKEVRERLRSQIAIRHIKTQEYNIGKKQGRNRKLDKIVESPENYASLSDRNLGLIMGVSNCTANRMKSEWSSLGLITIRPMWSVLVSHISETHYRQAKANGGIPIHAVYQRRKRRIVVRKADSVCIGADPTYKYQPYSWIPDMVSKKAKI